MREPVHPSSHLVRFEPAGISREVEAGLSVFDAASSCGLHLRSDCGGKGHCGKCRILPEPAECLSPPTDEELSALSPELLAAGERLACLATVAGPGVLTIPEELLEDRGIFGKTGVRGTFPLGPAVERIVLPAAGVGSGAEGSAPDVAGMTADRVRTLYGKEVCFEEPCALRDLSRLVDAGEPVTLVNRPGKGVIAVHRGARPRSLGLAVDVGTTTVALYLCDLQRGTVLGSAGAANPQRRYGEDVISRIAFASEHPDGTDLLQAAVVREINDLGTRLLESAGCGPEDVDEVAIVGNTTMETLLAGFHPHTLGMAPYRPLNRFPGDFRSSDLGLCFRPGVNVHLLPVISGFVGGDTLGAILSEKPHEKDEISLIIDIGTNGEVVAGNRHGLWVTSCATGPALEGAHISRGMRATAGAIHKVDIDPGTLRVHCEILGGSDGVKPQGICGSGIIDTVAAMRRAGLMLPTGRMVEGMKGVVVDERGVGRRFILADRDETGSGRDVSITLQDVRHVQLAKAALFAGIRLLLRKAGLDRVDTMILTGAFGARFDWRNAVAIGMLPPVSKDVTVKVVENAAGVGAIMALLDRKRRQEARRLAETVQFLELAEEPDFPTEFPRAMSFP
ncbi:MAG: ASKHA domain-containing protein [Desulfobacteraceae bacterium]|nr:ASKHA domain-containing protein [Desulfobacteraceae bacterium]